MHEMGLAKDVLRKILEEAHKHKLTKVTYADVNIGETLISHREEFNELFEQVSRDTPAEGVRLNVTIIPLMAFCKGCSKDFSAKQMRTGCPHCSGNVFHIVSGKEIVIKELK